MPSLEGPQQKVLAKLPPEDRQPVETSPEFWSHLFHVVEALALFLAVAAMYYEGRHANELLEDVKGIAANMSTRWVGKFPDSLGPISEDLSHVCGTIDAMVDLPGYGFYSSPELFEKYYEVITGAAAREVLQQRLETPECANTKADLGAVLKVGQPQERRHPRVRMILFSPDDRVFSVHQQLKELGRPKGMTSEEEGTFMTFAERNKNLLSHSEAAQLARTINTPEGYNNFRALLQKQLCEIEGDLRSNEVQVRYAKDQFITRWWIVDRKSAIFSFDHKAITESAFKSSDYQMLANFNDIFESWWTDSVRYSDYWDREKKDHGATVSDMPSGNENDDPIDDVKSGREACIQIVPDLIASAQKKGK